MNFDEFWMLGLGPKRISHHFPNHPRSSQWQLRAAESTLLAPRLVPARHGTAPVAGTSSMTLVSEAETLSGTTLKFGKQAVQVSKII